MPARLVAHIPVGDPGQLTVRVLRAGLGHLGQAQVGRLRQQHRVQRSNILDRLAGMQMGKVPAPARQLVDLDQQVGDSDPAQQLVGAAAKLLCLGRDGGSQGSDRQTAMAQSHIRELVVGQQACHLRHRLVDLIAPLLEIRLARGLDCDRDRPGLSQFAPRGPGSRYSSKARYWRLPATHTSPARRRSRKVFVSDSTAGRGPGHSFGACGPRRASGPGSAPLRR